MPTITISINDNTYEFIKSRAKTSVECRAAAMLELAVDAQQELEKHAEDQDQGDRENVAYG